jgi:hypothetical protein
MFNSARAEGRLSNYILTNCKHVLTPFEGFTKIPINYTDPSVLDKLPSSIELTNSHSVKYIPKVDQVTCGVYVFYNDDEVVQCGSSIDMFKRLRSHYRYYNKLDKPFYKDAVASHGGLSAYKLAMVETTKNYREDFLKMYPDATNSEKLVLRSITQQEIRTLEQSYSSYANPKYWKGNNITLWHNKWNVGNVLHEKTGVVVKWMDEQNEIYSRESLNKRSQMLDLSTQSLTRVANWADPHYINSPTFGKVKIIIPAYAEQTISGFAHVANVDVDYTSLVPNKFYLFDKDMNKLNVEYFDSLKKLNKFIGLPEARQNWHWVNIMHLVKAPALGTSVYIVCNKVNKRKPIIVTNLTTGETTELNSMYAATKFVLGPSFINKCASFIQCYVIPRKPYNNFLVEFKREEDHLSTKARIKKDGRNTYLKKVNNQKSP